MKRVRIRYEEYKAATEIQHITLLDLPKETFVQNRSFITKLCERIKREIASCEVNGKHSYCIPRHEFSLLLDLDQPEGLRELTERLLGTGACKEEK